MNSREAPWAFPGLVSWREQKETLGRRKTRENMV